MKTKENKLKDTERIEQSLLDCQLFFSKFIDSALDCYNDNIITKEVMEQSVAESRVKLDEISLNIEEVQQIRRELLSQ